MFVYASPLDRRLARRPEARLSTVGHDRRLLLHGRPPAALVPVAAGRLRGAHLPGDRQRLLQAERLGDGRNLYPEGSHLKDRAYNIFYMGINVGAFLAPVVAEFVSQRCGFHPAFAVAAFGMVISVVDPVAVQAARRAGGPRAAGGDGPGERRARRPSGRAIRRSSAPQRTAIDDVPDARRIGALIVIFLIVIVFWMVFHQNGSTLTYWANDNTDWNVSGIISNAINPFWVVTLTFPLVWFWKWLDSQGQGAVDADQDGDRHVPDGAVVRRALPGGDQGGRRRRRADVAGLADRRLRGAHARAS